MRVKGVTVCKALKRAPASHTHSVGKVNNLQLCKGPQVATTNGFVERVCSGGDGIPVLRHSLVSVASHLVWVWGKAHRQEGGSQTENLTSS